MEKLLNKEDLVKGLFLEARLNTFFFGAVPIVLETTPVDDVKDEHKLPQNTLIIIEIKAEI